jgi:regulator of extracellular matrix RemA (YlzA/DUF370 family)
LLAATIYQGNPERSHKLWNIVSTERYILLKTEQHEPYKTLGVSEVRSSGRIHDSCSTNGTSLVILDSNPVISHERGKDRIVVTTN